MKQFLIVGLSLMTLIGHTQQGDQWKGKFEQLGPRLPTPNEYRDASGAPGPRYWQQQADYDMDVVLDDGKQLIHGREVITYHNNSPEELNYLWLQLDQNILAYDNLTDRSQPNSIKNGLSAKEIAGRPDLLRPGGGFNITSVKSKEGVPLTCTVNHTMMRIDLQEPLKSGQLFSFSVEWSYEIANRMINRQRSGLEYFAEDGNFIYTIGQFFPRMCVFDDVDGWQNKQFLGQGEFALPFGNYKVRITVPSDHLVAATGTLVNPGEVLSGAQLQRLERARVTFDKPVIIVTETEAEANEKSKTNTKKTWEFRAENVRDFAFASSRKFIWDAMAVKVDNKTPLAMSFYPKEGNPLWELESTRAIKNALITYSKYTFDYPYPVAIAVHSADIGMEYPMISFDYGRPVNGVYSDRTKYRMIGVIIHEIGHNYFPMIVNSDERQWTWMDEGLNSFLEYRTEVEQYENFPSRRGPAELLVPYMKADARTHRPLMVNPEQVIHLEEEQYAKCATALSILREVVMGPELFDYAFKLYAARWAFKEPQPADFFRTMEDASAIDLDWFWKGWFYSVDNVNISIDSVKWYRLEQGNPGVEEKEVQVEEPAVQQGDKFDFNHGPQPFHVIRTDKRFYGEYESRIDDQSFISKLERKNIYEVQFSNKGGGLIMPLTIEWKYSDGSREIDRLPAEIWRLNEHHVSRVFVKEKEVIGVELDPGKETTDVDHADNLFPRMEEKSKVETLKEGGPH
jgi:Peptidase family M1 domain